LPQPSWKTRTSKRRVALASNAPPPTPPPVVVLTRDVEIARLFDDIATLARTNEERQRESEERHRVIEHLEAEAQRAQAAAHEAQQQLAAIMRTRTFRIASAVGWAYTRLVSARSRRSGAERE
jgi:hypothetical protein